MAVWTGDATVVEQLKRIGAELDRRKARHALVEPYYEKACPPPDAIVQSKLTKAWTMLMPVADAPWGSLIVDSTLDRLEPSGIRDTDDDAADAAWGIWQDNDMDAEAKVAHVATLIDGRSHAMIWPDGPDAQPRIWLDDATQMAVMYEEGDRRRRIAAMRRWVDADGTPMATLYRPDAVFKFQAPADMGFPSDGQWEKREVPGEEWPIQNRYKTVPVVELAVNRRLTAGNFPHVRGDYEHAIGLIDRVHLLTFLGLVVAFWMGFPIRGVIGDKIIRDDDGNILPPFEVGADQVVQFANPDVKTFEFSAADRKNLSVFDELDQLAVITKTPRHYFPMSGGFSSISADAIRASEGALHAKVGGYQPSLGTGHVDLLRVGCQMLPQPVELSARAAMKWYDRESRSLAERADAATKLKDILPPQALAERVLNASQDDIMRWEGMRAGDAFSQVVAAATAPVAPPGGNGNAPTPPIPAG